ncbi:hypothetical protein ABE099_08005 [Paenibacillus turicensis]|uniref:hypothetical protein n=1 Tax=Paenibacillus turicensis TaxID=160487 RepID=UPI003D287D54
MMKLTKRISLVIVALTVFFAMVSPDLADARRGGGFKSGTRSYTTTPKKKTDSGIRKTDSSKSSTGSTGSTASNGRGFFSGGSLFKGMMMGGIAGLLFGSMFSGMGMMGNILGLAVNVFAIYIIVMLVMALFRRKQPQPQPSDDRGTRY